MAWLIKRGAYLDDLRPEIARLEPNVCEVYEQLGCKAVVTSGHDGQHKPGSLHYRDLAVDLRCHQLGSKRQLVLLSMMRRRLEDRYPGAYDIVLEGMGGENAHLHLEAKET